MSPNWFCLLIVGVVLPTAISMNCSAGTCQRELAEARLEQIKSTLLDALGLDRPPISSRPNLTMNKEILSRIQDYHLFDTEPTERTYVFGHDPFNGNSDAMVAAFKFSDSVKAKKIRSAHLHLLLSPPVDGLMNMKHVNVTVYEVMVDGTLGDAIASKKHTIRNRERYVDVPLNPADIERWWNEELVMGLYVDARFEGFNMAVHPQERGSEAIYIEIETQLPNSRRKRSRNVCRLEEEHKGCCLYDLLVDFKALGWTDIIAPNLYNAYMCAGDCAFNHHEIHSTYSHVAKGGQKIGRLTAIDGKSSCCYPAEFDSTKIIYKDLNENIVVKEVEGMVARKCACA